MDKIKDFHKLSWLQRIGFGSGDLAQKSDLSDSMHVSAIVLYQRLRP